MCSNGKCLLRAGVSGMTSSPTTVPNSNAAPGPAPDGVNLKPCSTSSHAFAVVEYGTAHCCHTKCLFYCNACVGLFGAAVLNEQ